MYYLQAAIGGIGIGVSYWVIVALPGDQAVLAFASGMAIAFGLLPFAEAAREFVREFKEVTRADH